MNHITKEKGVSVAQELDEVKADEYQKALETVDGRNPSVQVLSQASQAIRNPNVEVSELEKTLRSDTSMTSDIIKLSNSASYGFSTLSKDLGTSINRLGFDELVKLIGLAASKRLFVKGLDRYGMEALDYWGESVSTALMMESISKLIGEAFQEFYTVGLLSTVGKLVNEEILNAAECDAVYPGDIPVIDALRKIIPMDANVKAIMMSSIGTEENVEECLKLGAKTFIQKPINQELLLKTLRDLV